MQGKGCSCRGWEARSRSCFSCKLQEHPRRAWGGGSAITQIPAMTNILAIINIPAITHSQHHSFSPAHLITPRGPFTPAASGQAARCRGGLAPPCARAPERTRGRARRSLLFAGKDLRAHFIAVSCSSDRAGPGRAAVFWGMLPAGGHWLMLRPTAVDGAADGLATSRTRRVGGVGGRRDVLRHGRREPCPGTRRAGRAGGPFLSLVV
jgi:hypothetical protein